MYLVTLATIIGCQHLTNQGKSEHLVEYLSCEPIIPKYVIDWFWQCFRVKKAWELAFFFLQ
jgi:hypothetical protein